MPRPTHARSIQTLSPNLHFGSWRVASSLLRVELYVTPCIVTSPPRRRCNALVNPANERLQGTRFTPGECARYLAPGSNLLYPPQAIDGIVHGARGDSSGDAGGAAALAELISAMPVEADGVRCPTGCAVATRSTGELAECYDHVIHAVAPFYEAERWRELLLCAYHAAFDTAASEDIGAACIAVPLLGAGARGAPIDAAAEVAAVATAAPAAAQPASPNTTSASPPPAASSDSRRADKARLDSALAMNMGGGM